MAVLSVFEDAFNRRMRGFDAWSYHKAHRRYWQGPTMTGQKQDEVIGDLLEAVQSVVDGLTTPDGGRYVVGFTNATGAATDLSARRMKISSAPIFDSTLSLAEIATILTGLAAHEAGHADITPGMAEAVERIWKNKPLAKVVANLIDDVALERKQAREYPGIAPAFPVTLRWMARVNPVVNPVGWANGMPIVDRVNFAINSVRYARFCRWYGTEPTRTERLWWQQWAETYADPDDLALRIEGVRVALTRLTVPPTYEDQPAEQPPVEVPEPEDDEESDEDEDGDGGGNGEGDEDEDEDGWDEDDDDADTDPGEPGEGDDDDEDLDDAEPGDKPGGGNARGESADDDDEDDDEDGNEAETLSDSDGSDGQNTDLGFDNVTHEDEHHLPDDGDEADGSGGKGDHPVSADDLPDIDRSSVAKSVDDINDRSNTYDDNVQRAVDERQTVERIRDAHGFGTMRVRMVD